MLGKLFKQPARNRGVEGKRNPKETVACVPVSIPVRMPPSQGRCAIKSII